MTTVWVGLHDEGAATDPCVGWGEVPTTFETSERTLGNQCLLTYWQPRQRSQYNDKTTD